MDDVADWTPGTAEEAVAVGHEACDDPALQEAWFSTEAFEWRSLALVPASDDVRVVELARLFATLGFRNRGESIGVADLRDVALTHLASALEVIQWHVRRGERVILALQPSFRSAATVPLVRAADCALLCLSLGTTRIYEASETVERVGRESFIGSLIVQPGITVPDGPPLRPLLQLGAFS